MKKIVLLGGGHAHVHVLKDLAREPIAGAEVLLVSPHPRQVYSGMLPGFIAGHYTLDACAIALAPLCEAARVLRAETAATAIDAAARVVTLADGQQAEYDLLSIDTGSVMDRDAIAGAHEHGLFVRPIEHFVRLFDRLVDLASRRALDIVVIGAGAAGFELALALQHRFSQGGEERARLAIVSGGAPPLAGYPEGVVDRALGVLRKQRVNLLREACAAIEAGHVVLGNGARLACDAPVLAIGSSAPRWLQASGLTLDERGFVLTGATLQSASHPEVFAVGDVATRSDIDHPRSGVYAVRAGAPLARNLRALVQGTPPLPHKTSTTSLNLLSCGERSAIVSWNGVAARGRLAWWWKDRIDRGFIARYALAAAAG
jgi:pyridine nucleotide-disulfide oxidoreductase family protein